MARKTAEDAGLDAAAAKAEQDVAAAAAQASNIERQRGGGQATVLSTGPIPEVKLGPAAGAPPIEGDAVDPNVAGRFLLDPSSTAPVIADATKRPAYRRAGAAALQAQCGACGAASSSGRFCAHCGSPLPEGSGEAQAPAGEPKEERWFAVLETKMVLDKTGGHRTPLRAGKLISDKHYDVPGLIRQGAKLKRVEGPTSASTDEALIAALT